ncbi:uncharacterized protein IWZ02DRAFT_431088 [Phyllosticta citriasiana]|uniref:uncharacterized protein n=1 Tax=Phyllosticta citriasiana TaxID=595635 RepID=UPI0030FD2798
MASVDVHGARSGNADQTGVFKVSLKAPELVGFVDLRGAGALAMLEHDKTSNLALSPVSPTMDSTSPVAPRPAQKTMKGRLKSKREDHDVNTKPKAEGSGILAGDREILLAGQSGVLNDLLGYVVSQNTNSPEVSLDPADKIKLLQQFDMWSPCMTFAARASSSTTANWQTRILGFVAEKVEERRRAPARYRDEPGGNGAQAASWHRAAEYRKNPMKNAMDMWASVKNVVEWAVIFNPLYAISKNMEQQLKNWRTYFLRCFTFAAERSFIFRHLKKLKPEAVLEFAAKNEEEYSLFRSMRLDSGMIIVNIQDLSIPRDLAYAQKRRRTIEAVD